MKQILLLLLPALFGIQRTFAQDSIFIKVHFLYGSTPKKAFKNSERTWFGGKLGGHVGIEVDSNHIIDFVPSGGFHRFASKDDFHSSFVVHTEPSFWSIFGGKPEDMKKATFVIPVSKAQKLELDSIAKAYTANTPYDYAFFGMRCGAAAYDVLSQLEIFPRYSIPRTYRKIFYPKKLRKKLFKKAEANGWKVYRQPGTEKRNWEKG